MFKAHTQWDYSQCDETKVHTVVGFVLCAGLKNISL